MLSTGHYLTQSIPKSETTTRQSLVDFRERNGLRFLQLKRHTLWCPLPNQHCDLRLKYVMSLTQWWIFAPKTETVYRPIWGNILNLPIIGIPYVPNCKKVKYSETVYSVLETVCHEYDKLLSIHPCIDTLNLSALPHSLWSRVMLYTMGQSSSGALNQGHIYISLLKHV